MADESAELAFLQSMQADPAETYNGSYDPPETVDQSDEEEEDYDPSSLMPDTSYSTNADDDVSNLDPSAAAASGNDTVAASSGTPQQTTDSAGVVKQPRTMGGFVVDDDDDEDDTSVSKPKGAISSGLLSAARASSQTPQRSLSQTPNTSLPVPDVTIPESPHPQPVSDAVANGATTDAPPNLAAILPDPSASASAKGDAESPKGAPPPQSASSVAGTAPLASLPRARLPHDRVGILEDRIKEDPRGDMDAWLTLVSEHRKRHKLDEARAVYERFLKVFPTAAEQWVAYANMELENDNFKRAEEIFGKSILSVPNVQLWTTYLDYVRRFNNPDTDPSGKARQIVSQAYDLTLRNVGVDKDSGRIWHDYVQFVKSSPGNVGGTNWQDQQKMDLVRKAYQQAVCVPTSAVTGLWKEYYSFEKGLNKMTGSKFLQEKSPAYTTAHTSFTHIQNITRELDRTTIPRLPPALGFDRDVEYMRQVETWRRWTEWEKDDPLVLKDEDLAAYKSRVVYVYKQAVMALRFWPEMWYEAAEFCFQNGLESDGNEFLSNGVAANPESCLLAFKRADRVELSTASDEGENSAKRRGEAVREPYDKVLDALYDLVNRVKARETQNITRIKEYFAQQLAESRTGDDDDDDDEAAEMKTREIETAQRLQVEAIQNGNAAQVKLLSRTISFAWISLMRAMRRVQGKGKVNDPIGGSRQIFSDARKRGRLTSDVYVASALIEYHCYKDPAATKILERGTKLFPEDENFALEYLKHLIAINDITNARAVFETTVSKLAQKPETLQKAKPIYHFFHEYEAHYGELSQVSKLEKRMADLFPEDPQLARFSHRYSVPGFDPTAIRPIISPAVQARPKALPSIEQPPSAPHSPRPMLAQTTSSPKRPLQDDFDFEEQPRKFARGESPLKGAALKGAAGRRLDAQKRRAADGGNVGVQHTAPAPSLPREVMFLLSIIPPAHTYNATVFSPQRMVELLRTTDLTRSSTAPALAMQGQPQAYGQPNGAYGFYSAARW